MNTASRGAGRSLVQAMSLGMQVCRAQEGSWLGALVWNRLTTLGEGKLHCQLSSKLTRANFDVATNTVR